MNIRDLEYLLSVADLGHFGKAADACFVSQPTLSMQTKKLEEDLGVKLLERTNKTALLTDHGDYFLYSFQRAKINSINRIVLESFVGKADIT